MLSKPSRLRGALSAPSPAPSPDPVVVTGCPLCEQVGGRLLQHHEAFRIIAVDDHELPGVARIIWNSHVQEVSDLDETQRGLLMQALYEAELKIRTLIKPQKINLASFGNKVPHLHFHLIPRWRTDPWWPESSWAEKPPLVWRGVAATGFDESEFSQASEPALITVGDWARLKDLASLIREEVFVKEQGVPQDEEWDDQDRICRHAVVRIGESAVATGRLMPDGRIGRMAVLKPWRGKGLGKSILRSLIEEAFAKSIPHLYLHAQIHALGFYAQQGFEAYGDEFLECNIPHRAMQRATPSI